MDKEEVLFENSFIMTQERYVALCKHPKGKRAIKQLRQWNVIMAVFTLITLLIAIYGITQRQTSAVGFGLGFFIVFIYKLFFQWGNRSKKQYAEIRRTQATKEWRRTLRFFESGIEFEEANIIMKIGYNEITRLTQEEECDLLWRGDDFVIRLMRCEFTRGSYDDFIAFIRGKLAENAENKAD